MADQPRTLDDAAAALYAAPRAEFVQRRAELSRAARAAGDKALAREIAELRKPSVSAAALNAFARADGEAVARLLRLAEDMRAAQRTADGEALRRLGRDRQEIVPDVVERVRRAAADAGEPLSAASLTDVEHGVRRAIVDPRFADELGAGRVASVPSGPVEIALDGALDTTSDEPTPDARPARASTRPERRAASRRDDEARQRHAAAVDALAAATARLRAAHDAARAVEERHAHAQQRVDDLREELRTLEAAAHELAADLRAAHGELRRAEADARRAQRDEERLRSRASESES